MVAADGKQPVLARRVLFAQDFRSDGEVAVRVQQLAGLRVAMRVVAEIDLAEAGKMLHAFNSLASGGRSRGLRILMITQRPAKLHKDTLTCADTLVAMRVLAPQDRKAIEEWINGAGDAKASRQVLDSLAAMKTGEGWVWYPDGGVLERTVFPRIRTYDSSATPEDDAERPNLPVSPDLDRIRTILGEAAERAAADDPVKLRKRVAELERELRQTRALPTQIAQPADIEEQLNQARRDGVEQAV